MPLELTGDDLKALRSMKKMTQSEIGSIVFKNANTIACWEKGTRAIDPAFAKLLLLELGVTYEDIQAFKNKEKVVKKPCQSKKEQTLLPFNQFKKTLEELQVSTHQKELAECTPDDIKFIDLFSGVGGIRRAFEKAGAKCVFSSEINIFAQYTYFANYGTVPYGDITKIKAEDIPDHDVLCAGFPCQPFSHIGKREGFKHPTQGTMFHEIVRILETKRPRMIFLENVPGIINHDDGRTLKVIIESLENLGYKCTKTVLDAYDFGVPQHRKRFYLVGTLNSDSDFSFPTPPQEHVDIGDYLETDVVGYGISKHLQQSYLFKKDDGRPFLIDKNTKGPVKTLVCSYHKIQRLTGTFVKDGDTGIRLLTASECKAIMGFPQDFIIPVSRTQMYRQMGNSVVVKVIESIADAIVADYKKSFVD